MKLVLSLILMSVTALNFMSCNSLISKPKPYNLNFEMTHKDSAIGWYSSNQKINDSYKSSLDSKTVKEGRYSASISFVGDSPSGSSWFQTINDPFPGDSITISGYIKTENVTEGYAGLWMRMDPFVALDNMENRGIRGTTDWTKLSITLPLNQKNTQRIVFGGMLVGKGKMWIDDLHLSIDGKDISTIVPMNKLPADSDFEFVNGSLVNFDNLGKDEQENLFKVGLIWGFLKYYHPSIIEGKYNWDNELFRILSKLTNKKKGENIDLFLYNWILSLGALNSYTEEIKIDTAVVKPDLNWISNAGFNSELETLLNKIKKIKRSPLNQYYVTTNPGPNNAVFLNERSYHYKSFPDAGFRLLALYRYWNMVQYYFPYKNSMEKDWKSVLKFFLPKFINAKDELEYKLNILELTSHLNDSHGFVLDDPILYNYFGERMLPIKVKFIDNKYVVSDFRNTLLAEKEGWKIGDIITKIGNISIKEKINNLSKYTAASNKWTMFRDIEHNIIRTNDLRLDIEIERGGVKQILHVNSFERNKLIVDNNDFVKTNISYKWLSNNIGYIDHGKLKLGELESIFDTFKNSSGLIIDLRNYPVDYLALELPKYLLSKPTAFVKFLSPDITNPGSFTYMPEVKTGTENNNPYKGKLILLINETTQSSAEYHTMAYSVYPNTLIVGSNSAGADGDVTNIILPGNIKTRFSGIGIFYPDGTPTQRVGIKPDVILKPTIKGLINKKDEVLEMAIKLIN